MKFVAMLAALSIIHHLASMADIRLVVCHLLVGQLGVLMPHAWHKVVHYAVLISEFGCEGVILVCPRVVTE
jgi:hypothetical protein